MFIREEVKNKYNNLLIDAINVNIKYLMIFCEQTFIQVISKKCLSKIEDFLIKIEKQT
jgi:hypothetical protein